MLWLPHVSPDTEDTKFKSSEILRRNIQWGGNFSKSYKQDSKKKIKEMPKQKIRFFQFRKIKFPPNLDFTRHLLG